MNNEIELRIYHSILDNLDNIICLSESKNDIYNNIKLLTYYYLLETNEIYIIEEFSSIIDSVKVAFWSSLSSTISGKISLFNWIGGVGLNYVVNKNFNLGTSLLVQFLQKLNINPASIIQTTKLVSLILFPIVVIGLLIYRLINYKDIILIKNFELTLKSVMDSLALSNKSEFKSEIVNINIKYKELLTTTCLNIEQEESRLICASEHYIKYISENILTKVIYEYLTYNKDRNVDLSYINTFYDLCNLNINITNKLLFKRLNILYELYNKLLKSFVFNELIRIKYIDLLDNTTDKFVKEIFR